MITKLYYLRTQFAIVWWWTSLNSPAASLQSEMVIAAWIALLFCAKRGGVLWVVWAELTPPSASMDSVAMICVRFSACPSQRQQQFIGCWYCLLLWPCMTSFAITANNMLQSLYESEGSRNTTSMSLKGTQASSVSNWLLNQDLFHILHFYFTCLRRANC